MKSLRLTCARLKRALRKRGQQTYNDQYQKTLQLAEGVLILLDSANPDMQQVVQYADALAESVINLDTAVEEIPAQADNNYAQMGEEWGNTGGLQWEH